MKSHLLKSGPKGLEKFELIVQTSSHVIPTLFSIPDSGNWTILVKGQAEPSKITKTTGHSFKLHVLVGDKNYGLNIKYIMKFIYLY